MNPNDYCHSVAYVCKYHISQLHLVSPTYSIGKRTPMKLTECLWCVLWRLLSIFYPCVSQYTAHSLMVLLTYSDVFWAYLDIRALSSATMSSLCSDHDELIVVSCIRRLPSTISTYFCRAFFQLIYQGISFPSEWRNCPPSFSRVDASTIWRIVLATSATEGASGFASVHFFIQPLVSADMLYCTVSGILRVR